MRSWRRLFLTLAAWLLTSPLALAQPPDLVRLILQPESVVQISVQGNATDTTENVSGAKAESHAEGYSALAAFAAPVIAFAATVRSETSETEAPEFEYRVQQEFQGALAGLRLGPLGLFGGVARESFQGDSATPDVDITFEIEEITDSLYGVSLAVGAGAVALRLAFVQYAQNNQQLKLRLDVSGFSLVKEAYPTTTVDLAVQVSVGREKGFFADAYYKSAEQSRAEGVEVDYNGASATTRTATVGWRTSGKTATPAGFSLSVSLFRSKAAFEDFLSVDQEELSYGAELILSSGISLNASLTNRTIEQRFDLAGYVVESESRVVAAGLGYRF